MDSVACSDGANGLETKGYSTLGSLPNFPYVGGAPAVTGWNSAGVRCLSPSWCEDFKRCHFARLLVLCLFTVRQPLR